MEAEADEDDVTPPSRVLKSLGMDGPSPSATEAPSTGSFFIGDSGSDSPPLPVLLPASISKWEGEVAGVSNGVSMILSYIGLQMYMSWSGSSVVDDSGEASS